MKSLAFLLLQGLYPKLDNKSYSSQRKILEMPIFLDLFSERRLHLLILFILLRMKGTTRLLAVSKNCINSNPYWIT
jgi:hypothetical protein